MLDAVAVGNVIQDLREKKGLSQDVVSGFADLLGSDTKNYYMCDVGKYDRIYNAYLCTCDKYKSRNPSTKEYKR